MSTSSASAEHRACAESTGTHTAHLLKRRTAPAHQRVEDALGLLDPDLSTRRLGVVLTRLYGFWRAGEPAVDRWWSAGSAAAHSLEWTRRRRTDVLAADLRVLGVDPNQAPVAPNVFDLAGDAEALGWAYVAEGSTLGGVVIARRLRPLTTQLGVPLRFFAPYPEGPRPMWRAYLAALREWVGSDARRNERVLAAAARTFNALDAWVEPLRHRAPPPTEAMLRSPGGCSG